MEQEFRTKLLRMAAVDPSLAPHVDAVLRGIRVVGVRRDAKKGYHFLQRSLDFLESLGKGNVLRAVRTLQDLKHSGWDELPAVTRMLGSRDTQMLVSLMDQVLAAMEEHNQILQQIAQLEERKKAVFRLPLANVRALSQKVLDAWQDIEDD